MTVTAQLSAVSGLDVTVPYTMTGTATGGGTDYTITDSPLTISAGSTTASATITISGDVVDEQDETVIATIGTPTNASQGSTLVHTATITDEDTPVALSVSGSTLAENGGTATFTATLATISSLNVTVNLSFSGTSSLGDDFTRSGTSITVTAGSTTGTVTVTGVNDFVDEEDETVIVDISSVTNGIESGTQQKSAAITDDDTAGVTLSHSGGNTQVTEGGSTDTYTLVLNSQPSANVTLTLDPGTQLSLSSGTVTFTSANWSTVQTVTVTAVNDSVAESLQSSSVTHASSSSDSLYSGLSLSLSVSVTDNDEAGVSLSESGGGTQVTEAGTTDSYTVMLTSQPTGNVTVSISGGDEAGASPTSLIFTAANWSSPQTVTITAVDDSVAEGNHAQNFLHTSSSNDSFYSGISIATLATSITDNDSAGVSLAATEGSTNVTTGGDTDTYTIVLTSQPTASVTVTVNSDNQVQGDPSTLVFSTSNWGSPQTVEVSVVSDDVTETSGTLTHTVSSNDPEFNNIAVSSLSVMITDSIELASDAGESVTIAPGETATLDGTGSAPQDEIVSYHWEALSQSSSCESTLQGATTANATYSALKTCLGDVLVTLEITGRDGETSSDSITIHVYSASDVEGEIVEEAPIALIGGATNQNGGKRNPHRKERIGNRDNNLE